MKTVKIAFCGLWDGDYFIKLLSDRVKIEISDKPDFVVCGVADNDFLKYGEHPIRIYCYAENIFPDFNLFDYAIGFQNIKFEDRHLCVPNYLKYDFDKLRTKNKCELPDSMAQRKFCNFIYRNADLGKGSKLRMEFVKKLMAYKHVDCPGKILNNMQNAIEPREGDWNSGKREFIKDYKFTIAFENSKSNGYTTEKIIDPLLSNSVPIYWGNEQVKQIFNPTAFINANDYSDLDALVQRVIELDNDDAQYLEMLRVNPVADSQLFEFDRDKEILNFIMNIFENGVKYTDSGIDFTPFHHTQRDKRKTTLYGIANSILSGKICKRLCNLFRI